MITEERAQEIFDIYAKAWIGQDPELILTIFTEDATYGEGYRGTYHGHERIKKYWQEKVVENQRDIDFKLTKLEIHGNTIHAEWKAVFFGKETNKYYRLDSEGTAEIKDDKIHVWKETWVSQKSDTPFTFEKD